MHSVDPILDACLAKSWKEWIEFQPQTDLVDVSPCGPEHLAADGHCRRFIAEFRCKTLARSAAGSITEVERSVVGISFGPDHLRRIDPHLVTAIGPVGLWHPNIAYPAVCLGHLRPGIGLVDILYQIYGILSYANMSTADFLNADAAAWARENRERFPIDRRPLKRRSFDLKVQEAI